MRHTAACVSGSIERRDDISARFPRATGWLYNQGILFAVVLIALLSALSGCGSGESDVGQTNGTVTGTITNARTGATLSGATVAGTGFSTTTDSNGNFTLTGVPPGPQTLTVSQTGFTPATKAVTVEAGTSVSAGAITLTPLPTFGTVTGTITDAGAGAPLSGATVGGNGFSTTTDSNGNFTLTGVPPGPQTLTVSRSGFRPTTKSVTVVAGKTVSAGTIALTPLTTFGIVTGTVFNATTGAPISGATVAVGSIPFTATTDTNGNFRLDGFPQGFENLFITAPGFSPASKGVTAVAGETVSAGRIALTPLPTTSTSTGTITDAGAGAPLSGATVGGIGFSTTTDSNGNFTLTGVPPGPQTLTVSRSGFSTTMKAVTVMAGETVSAGTIALTPLPTFGTITGTITNARTGAPLSGATVGVDSTFLTTTTDTKGNYTLAGVPPGPEELLSVTASGFSPATKGVTVVEGETVSADTIALLPVNLIR